MGGRADPARGWVRYDAGNSAFATVVVGAVLPVYLEEHVVPADGVGFLGGTWSAESLWALTTGAGPLLMLLAMPVLGALADQAGAKGRLLRLTSYGCAMSTVALFVATDVGVAATLGVFLLAALFYAAANVLYDGLLVDVAAPQALHRVSARGIAAGFIGGGAHLALSLVVIAIVATPLASRAVIASVGIWFAVFTWWSWRDLRAVQERSAVSDRLDARRRLRAALARTATTLRHVRRGPDLTRFVLAHLLYSNAIQAFVVLTAVYSAATLQLSATVIIGAFLLVQILSIPACYGAARLAVQLGARTALLGALAVWVAIFVAAASLPAGATIPYLALALAVGLVLGPVIAIGRSLFASMIPASAPAQFFAFWSLASKASSVSGPLVFAGVRQLTGSGRAAILAVGLFVAAGLLLLRTVDVDRGRRARGSLLGRELDAATP